MNTEFAHSVILRLCKQPRTFEYISKNLNGLDPIQVHEALKYLEKQNTIYYKKEMWSIKDDINAFALEHMTSNPNLYLKKYMGYFDFLKTPHPLV